MGLNKTHMIDVAAAKVAVALMFEEWNWWKMAGQEELKREHLAKYAAAYTICRVFLKTFLHQLYPQNKLPTKIEKNLSQVFQDMEKIENMSESNVEKLLRDIDRLTKEAA